MNWGLITGLAAIIGLILTMHRYLVFRKHAGEMPRRIALVFLTDSFMYFITVGFGAAMFIGFDADWILYPARLVAIMLNIYFGIRLTRPLK